MAEQMKILITGAAGQVGSQLIEGMGDRYALRGLDRSPVELEDSMVGDLNGDGILNILDVIQLVQVILNFFIDDADIKNK